MSAEDGAGVTGARKRYPRRETVSTEPGILGRVVESVAQSADGRIQAVIEINEGVGGPETLAQLFAGNYLARGLKEFRQYSEKAAPAA